MVIKSFYDFGQRVSKSDEINHVLIFVECSRNFGAHAVVMAVNAFANVASKGNKMCGAKN